MGKNLKDESFSFEGWSTNPCGKIELAEPAQFTGNWKKKPGRKKMYEKFFYNPEWEYGVLVGVDVANGVQIGDVVVNTESDIHGYITQIRSETEVKIKWEITYGTI